MTSRPTQRARVLEVLRRRGAAGTHRLEWVAPDVVDGGPPILHLAGRIDELKKDGHVIEASHRRADGIVTYVLVGDAAAAATRRGGPVDGERTEIRQERLIDLTRVDVDVDLADFELPELDERRRRPTAGGTYDPFGEWA